MQDYSSIYIINKVDQLPTEKRAKILEHENGSSAEDSSSISNSQFTFKIVAKYKVTKEKYKVIKENKKYKFILSNEYNFLSRM